MSEYKDVLERSRGHYRPEPDGFERLRRRRDRKRRNERIAAAVVALILVAAAIGGAVSILRAGEKQTPAAPTVTTVQISAPKGDALPGYGYLDIVSAAVSKEGDWFDFTLTLSDAIPSSFEIPLRYDAVGYEFCLDTDPSTAPAGYPFAPTTTPPCEFILMATSEGGELAGTLLDRRPLLDGGAVETSPIPVQVAGTQVLMSAPAGDLDDPASFTWVSFSSFLTLPLGTDRYANVDEAPMNLDDPAPWPSG